MIRAFVQTRLPALYLALYLAFALAMPAWSACIQQPIDFGETRTGVIASDDCLNDATPNVFFYYDSYTFSGVTGQKIAITHTSTAFDPFLFLVNPDKTFLSDNNSGGGLNARIPASGFLTLAQTGTYEIQAVTATQRAVGAYTLTLSSSTPASCHVAAQPASSAGLPLPAGTQVTISAVCGSGATPITYTWDSGAFTGAVRTVAPAATTTYNIVASNANGASPPFSITVFVAAPIPGTPTIEYYNVDLAHYFVTAAPAEATAIDNGSAGPGWVRTGFSYDVHNSPVASSFKTAAVATNPVCRFYGTPGVGPNSHFYTVDANECAQVKRDPGWFYEGIAFHIAPPQFGGCPTGTQPVYRVYNNRAQFNDSNHRFITNKTTFLQMGEQGWTLEGIVMCTGASRAPTTPVTGGTFKDPSGAGVTVAPGQIPASVNAAMPVTRPARNLPPGMVEPSQGETNVTSGAPGYQFDLTGDTGFTTTTPNAISISLPFSTASIPAANRTPVKVQARIHDPKDKTQIDLAGSLAVNGVTGMLTVETRGLPRSFIASVVYNPNLDTASSDQAPGAAPAAVDAADPAARLKAGQATWPAQAWCIIYNPISPTLIASVKTILGLAGNPTQAQIRNVLIDRVGLGARRAQSTFENDGHAAPNLIVANTCGGTTPRYDIHMETEGSGIFVPNDPGEAISSRGNHYGRLYIDNARLDDAVSTSLGSVLASIAHEMHHASQSTQGLITLTTKGYVESAAALYGKTIDNNGVLRVRAGETQILANSLMDPAENNQYENQDFLAYVGRKHNGGSLNFLTGLYAQMQGAIAGSDAPDPGVTYGAMDAFFKSRFSASLQTIYLDFVKERALTHNQHSVMGHPGEITAGFAANLFGSKIAQHSVNVSSCGTTKIAGGFSFIDKFATAAVVITASGTVPASSAGPTLNVNFSLDTGSAWSGWTYRANVAAGLTTIANRFAGFGKQAGEQIVILLSNLDPASDNAISYEITCGGVKIDSIAPVKGPVGTVVTINGSGFGAQGDPRSVTFNGVAATGVTWVSDAQLRATVPANASSGDVIVTVNGEKSNGVPFEVVAQCSAQQTAGGDTPDIRTIELGKTSGTFNFTYQTFSQEDRIIVRYPNATGAVLLDTGCVGATATRALTYSGSQSTISVQVIPNCKGGSGTAWNYTVSCP